MAISKINSKSIEDLQISADDLATGSITSAKLESNITVTGDLTVDTNTLKVDSTNNRVGIGISSPSNVLHIVSTNATAILQRTTVVGNNSGLSTFDFKNSDSTVSAIANFNKSGSTKSTGADGYEFRLSNFGNGYTSFFNDGSERMRITSAGDVQIATTNKGTSAIREVSIGNTSEEGGITLWSRTTGEHGVNFGDGYTGTDRYRGAIAYRHTDDVMYFRTSSLERMRINSSGDFLVGKTSTSVTTAGDELRADGEAVFVRAGGHCLRLQRLTNEGNVAVFYNNVGTNTGSISVGGSSTAYNTSSDYRLKNNISDVLNAIDRVKQLKPIRFSFIVEPNKTVDGFLAHEVQDVVPEAITGEKDATRIEQYEITPAVLNEEGSVITEAVMGTREVPDYQGIDQAKLVPLLTAGLQEAIAKIETLEARLTALENK